MGTGREAWFCRQSGATESERSVFLASVAVRMRLKGVPRFLTMLTLEMSSCVHVAMSRSTGPCLRGEDGVLLGALGEAVRQGVQPLLQRQGLLAQLPRAQDGGLAYPPKRSLY